MYDNHGSGRRNTEAMERGEILETVRALREMGATRVRLGDVEVDFSRAADETAGFLPAEGWLSASDNTLAVDDLTEEDLALYSSPAFRPGNR